jgi:hypothetical protein
VNRRGEWIQIFAISLFVIFLVVAMILLSLNKDSLQDERPQLQTDLVDQQANVLLINLLRSPTQEGTLADTIILKHSDDSVTKLITERMPKDTYYEFYVQWPDHTLYVRNYEIRNDVEMIKHVRENYGRTPVGEGVALLPTGIKLKVFIADPSYVAAYQEKHGQAMEKKFEVSSGKIDIDGEHSDTASTWKEISSWAGAVKRTGGGLD